MTLDLSDCETAEEAAKKLYAFLKEEYSEDVTLYAPEENPHGTGCWNVMWESGPFEWAVNLTLENSIYAAGSELAAHETMPEVTGFYSDNGWFAEPYRGFDIEFAET